MTAPVRWLGQALVPWRGQALVPWRGQAPVRVAMRERVLERPRAPVWALGSARRRVAAWAQEQEQEQEQRPDLGRVWSVVLGSAPARASG